MTTYITAADIQAYLDQLSLEANDESELLDSVAERATSIVDAALDFQFDCYDDAPSVQRVAARPGPWLFLPAHELGSVTSVTRTVGEDVIDYAGKWEPVVERYGRVHRLLAVADGYEWDWSQPEAVEATCGVWLPRGGRRRVAYDVTAAWGYGPPPPSIVEVTLEVAVNIWRSKDSGGFAENIGVQSGGAVSIAQHVAGLSGSQQAIVDAVRRQYAPELPLEAVLL